MTSQVFQDPNSIRHFQSMCDACQELINTFHTPAELKLYTNGYLDALRREKVIPNKDQEKLEKTKVHEFMELFVK